MNTFIEVAAEIAESLTECNELLKFKHTNDGMDFNVLDDNNDVYGYRYEYLYSGSSLEKPLANLSDDLMQLNVTAINIEEGKYIFYSTEYKDIPMAHALATDYIISSQSVAVEEYAEKISDVPICLTTVDDTAIENLSILCPDTKFIKLDFSELDVEYSDSESLFTYAVKLQNSGVDGFSKIGTSLYSSYKNSMTDIATAPVVNSADKSEITEVKSKLVEVSLIVSSTTANHSSKIMTIALDELLANSKYQLRASEDASAIKDLVGAYKDGDNIPAIEVIDTGDKYIIVDGFHRFAAAREAGLDSIECEVTTGSEREAYTISLGANADNKALKRTNADKRKAVKSALDDDIFSELSSRELASICRVSHTIVNRIKSELSESVNISTLEATEATTTIPTDDTPETTLTPDVKEADCNVNDGNISTPSKSAKIPTSSISNKYVSLSVNVKEAPNQEALNNLLADLNGVIDSYKLEIEEVV